MANFNQRTAFASNFFWRFVTAAILMLSAATSEAKSSQSWRNVVANQPHAAISRRWLSNGKTDFVLRNYPNDDNDTEPSLFQLFAMPPRGGGGGGNEIQTKKKTSLLTSAFAFRMVAIGFMSFAVAFGVVPELLHSQLCRSPFPTGAPIYFWFFVIREFYVACAMWIVANHCGTMSAELVKSFHRWFLLFAGSELCIVFTKPEWFTFKTWASLLVLLPTMMALHLLGLLGKIEASR